MPAATPTISASFNASAGVGTIRVTSAGAVGVQVDRNVNGNGWRRVRYDSDATSNSSGVFVVSDYEAPGLTTIQYRARGVDSSGAVSANSNVVSISVPTAGYWLKDPSNPSLNMRIRPDREDVSIKKMRTQGVFHTLRGSRPLVYNGPIQGHEFEMKLLLLGHEEKRAYEAISDTGHTLLLQMADGRSWYVRLSAQVEFVEEVQADRITRPIDSVMFRAIEVASR